MPKIFRPVLLNLTALLIGLISLPALAQPSLPNRIDAAAITIDVEPSSQQIAPGADADFTVTIRNSGAVPLETVSVSSNVADCVRSLGALAVDAFVGFSCVRPDVTGDFVNTLVVEGAGNGKTVSSEASAVVDVLAAAISVSIVPEAPLVIAGTPLTFTIRLENIGNFPLNFVGVLDPLVPPCALEEQESRTLAVDESLRYQCVIAPLADFVHEITAVGSPPTGPQVSAIAQSTVQVISPALEVSITPAQTQLARGDSAELTVEVRNRGNDALSNVAVDSVAAPDCGRTLEAPLAAGAFIGYSCTLQPGARDITVEVISHRRGQRPDRCGHPAADSAQTGAYTDGGHRRQCILHSDRAQ